MDIVSVNADMSAFEPAYRTGDYHRAMNLCARREQNMCVATHLIMQKSKTLDQSRLLLAVCLLGVYIAYQAIPEQHEVSSPHKLFI